MTRVQILLGEGQKEFLDQVAEETGTNVSETVRRMVDEKIAQYKELQLARAAATLASLYEEDKDLVAFTALDSDEWDE
jgi:metal-responsive CopG/Arc/MetJ family transcriptional regulator